MKKILIVLSLLFLSACGGGSSDSGGEQVVNTAPGNSLPANFIGVYRGTLEVTATALGLSVTETFELTITVNEDGTVDFESDDETFSAGITNEGNFSVNVDVDEDECAGTITVSGSVDGTTASGSGEGEGQCVLLGQTADVTLEGVFNATM